MGNYKAKEYRLILSSSCLLKAVCIYSLTSDVSMRSFNCSFKNHSADLRGEKWHPNFVQFVVFCLVVRLIVPFVFLLWIILFISSAHFSIGILVIFLSTVWGPYTIETETGEQEKDEKHMEQSRGTSVVPTKATLDQPTAINSKTSDLSQEQPSLTHIGWTRQNHEVNKCLLVYTTKVLWLVATQHFSGRDNWYALFLTLLETPSMFLAANQMQGTSYRSSRF